jgi:acyl dehydratase
MSDLVSTYFEEYVPGTARVFGGRTITAEDIEIHAAQTGDFFPHHMDAEWCATQPFGRRMAHGTLVLSLAVGMTAEDVNPAAMTYGYDRIRFVSPVFIDDTISVTAQIISLKDYRKSPDSHGLVDEELRVTNQDGHVVLALVHIYLVEKRRRLPVESEPARGGPNTEESTTPTRRHT